MKEKESIMTGRVDTFIVKDEKNLHYRKDKSKRIHVFVPATYNNEVPHEVLYFFDAQNLFSGACKYTDKNDPYGGWKLDEALLDVQKKYRRNVLVVGLDNADEYRERELFMEPTKFGKLSSLATMNSEEAFGKGYLDELTAFIVETLHPVIKEKYVIDEGNIGIGGSSMGGIASFYMAMKELGFFKYNISYSPAYGLYEMEAFEVFFKKLDFGNNQDKLPKVHIYCGGGDPLEVQLLVAAKDMKETMIKWGYNGGLILESYDIEKVHNEVAWRETLPESLDWIFA